MHELIRHKGQDGTYCEKVIGSTPRVHTLAGFQEKNAPLMHLITLNALVEYMEDNDFTKDELIAFKQGVGAIGKFMSQCVYEREAARAAKKALKEQEA